VNAFAISTNSELTVDSSSFAVTKDAEFLSAILNSKVVLFYFKLGSVIWGKDGIKWFGNYFDNIPIPVISEENQKPLIELVNKILVIKNENQNNDTSALEKEIDDLVYKLYELTDEEIEIVEQ
jgi:adenine-specific DNA-methyltransferase